MYDIYKSNQRGSCKFKQHCRKEHENKIFESTNKCIKNGDAKKSLEISEKIEKGKFNYQCSYLHQKQVNPQYKVNESITILNLKHDKDIIALVDEITSLNFVLQSLKVQLLNKEYKIENTIDNTDQGGEQLN